MAMGCPHQGRSGGLNATITSRPFDSPRPSPGGYASTARSFPAGAFKSADGRARRHPPPGHYEPGAPVGR